MVFGLAEGAAAAVVLVVGRLAGSRWFGCVVVFVLAVVAVLEGVRSLWRWWWIVEVWAVRKGG